MKSVVEMSHAELAAFIQTHLGEKGIDVILSGGSAVAIYTADRYVSKDIDFVIVLYAKRSKIREAMEDLGFQQVGRHFEHPESEFLVEFPGGPPSVGSERIGSVYTYEYETGKLKIISPTDCVKDRLSAYYYWHDRQSLEQAIMVVEDNDVDLDEVARWSESEGKSDEFKDIETRLQDASRK